VLTRTGVKAIAIALTVLGVLLLIMAIVYLTTKASSLPSFVPGHLPGGVTKKGRVIHTHALVKRGVVLLIAAIGVFGTAWWLAFRYEPAD
jgi:hypothetical protein